MMRWTLLVRTAFRASLLLVLFSLACGVPPARNLDSLVLQDSTYLDSETLEPFSGDVFKTFPERPEDIQLTGSLLDGMWNGELTVYHATGRIRYQGRLVDGTQCGAWIENRESAVPESVYEELTQEIESLGLYPPCPDIR
jgi:hypothetical protein